LNRARRTKPSGDRPCSRNLAVRDIETLIHPYTQLASFRETGPLILERGEGVWVFDTEGKPYIEGMAGLWCTALGYSNEELIEAAAEQMRRCPSRISSRAAATTRRSSSRRN
jgi:4-aminobutyrate--pyruvate transaminase